MESRWDRGDLGRAVQDKNDRQIATFLCVFCRGTGGEGGTTCRGQAPAEGVIKIGRGAVSTVMCVISSAKATPSCERLSDELGQQQWHDVGTPPRPLELAEASEVSHTTPTLAFQNIPVHHFLYLSVNFTFAAARDHPFMNDNGFPSVYDRSTVYSTP